MACSKQPGPAGILHFVEDHTGVSFTQNEWHALRVLAKREEDATGARTRATKEEITESLSGLAGMIAHENGLDRPDYDLPKAEDDFYGDWLNPRSGDEDWINRNGHSGYFDTCRQLERDLHRVTVTKGTLEITDYISAWGADEARDRARAEIAASKGAKTQPEMDRKPDYYGFGDHGPSLADYEYMAAVDVEEALAKNGIDTRGLTSIEATYDNTDLAGLHLYRNGVWESEISEGTDAHRDVHAVLDACSDDVFTVTEEGPVGSYGAQRRQFRLDLDGVKPTFDADKQAALDALDRKVNKQRKRAGLSPITPDAKAS